MILVIVNIPSNSGGNGSIKIFKWDFIVSLRTHSVT